MADLDPRTMPLDVLLAAHRAFRESVDPRDERLVELTRLVSWQLIQEQDEARRGPNRAQRRATKTSKGRR